MAKVTLDSVAAGYNRQRVNNNFTSLATELNDKVLYRDNPGGEPNQMENDLDMNSNDILNANQVNATVLNGSQLIVNGVTITDATTAPRTEGTFTNVAGQSVFTVAYAPGLLEVYLNGVKLRNVVDFTATNGTSFTLTTPVALAADEVTYVAWGPLGSTSNDPYSDPYKTYGGSANAITLTSTTIPPVSFVAGVRVRFRATANNTGATTIALDSYPATACVTMNGSTLPSNYIRTDVDTEATYDGTNWVVDREDEVTIIANVYNAVKKANGQMIVQGRSASATATTSASGNVFKSNSVVQSFPFQFASTPFVTTSAEGSFGDPFSIQIDSVGVSSFDAIIFSSGFGESAFIQYSATGEWY